MLNDITGKRNSQVISQALFTKLSCKVSCRSVCKVVGRDSTQEIPAIQDFEEQFVAFFAVLAHEGREVFHRWRLDLLESVERIDLANRVEDVVSARHFLRSEVARPLWYAWFLCHFLFLYSICGCKDTIINSKFKKLNSKLFKSSYSISFLPARRRRTCKAERGTELPRW